jgi:hypothetical protein
LHTPVSICAVCSAWDIGGQLLTRSSPHVINRHNSDSTPF